MYAHDVKQETLTAGNQNQIRVSKARIKILQNRF